MIDRCGRIGMLMALCVCYPQYLFVLQLLVCLAIAAAVSAQYRYREQFLLCFQFISENSNHQERLGGGTPKGVSCEKIGEACRKM